MTDCQKWPSWSIQRCLSQLLKLPSRKAQELRENHSVAIHCAANVQPVPNIFISISFLELYFKTKSSLVQQVNKSGNKCYKGKTCLSSFFPHLLLFYTSHWLFFPSLMKHQHKFYFYLERNRTHSGAFINHISGASSSVYGLQRHRVNLLSLSFLLQPLLNFPSFN